MTENDARRWIRERFDVSRETLLARLVDLLREENARQNLIAPSTLEHIWARHIVDSAQLLDHVTSPGDWLDIGSGAGLPGLVLAILREGPIELVEPRRLRTQFLERAAAELDLRHVRVVTAKIERTRGVASVVTARAVANLGHLFELAEHRADLSTIWILPKGRNADLEVEAARHAWQGSFHVEPSVTAPDSLIVIAREVRRR